MRVKIVVHFDNDEDQTDDGEAQCEDLDANMRNEPRMANELEEIQEKETKSVTHTFASGLPSLTYLHFAERDAQVHQKAPRNEHDNRVHPLQVPVVVHSFEDASFLVCGEVYQRQCNVRERLTSDVPTHCAAPQWVCLS